MTWARSGRQSQGAAGPGVRKQRDRGAAGGWGGGGGGGSGTLVAFCLAGYVGNDQDLLYGFTFSS